MESETKGYRNCESTTSLEDCNKIGKEIASKECGICGKSTNSKENVLLKCKHWFHSICFIEAYKLSKECPYCKEVLIDVSEKVKENKDSYRYTLVNGIAGKMKRKVVGLNSRIIFTLMDLKQIIQLYLGYEPERKVKVPNLHYLRKSHKKNYGIVDAKSIDNFYIK